MTALYRKYRSKRLADVVGQRQVTDILERAIATDRISHAYLLTGPRGVGKTSVARILAHEINKLPYTDESTHLDIIEIDAASNNGVEDVRDLREKVRLAPVSATKKVYIIDEVHMLSKSAFNALLKTLEEPPEHVVFILATTDVDKLPATIISRTQQFNFRAIAPQAAIDHLRSIADAEKIKIDDEALALIADRGDGSFRDSISMLDQLSSLTDGKKGITAELVESILGLAPRQQVQTILDAVDKHDTATVIQEVTAAAQAGISAVVLTDQLLASVQTKIGESRDWLALFDGLLEVRQSSQPQLKLISVLTNAAIEPTGGKVSSAALMTPILEVSASVESLQQEADQEEPSEAHVQAAITKKKASSIPSGEFSWEKLVEHTRLNYVALFSVLSKCGYQFDDGELSVFARNGFYKKKLDDPKYNTMLFEAIQTLFSFEPAVHILATAPPPKSSQAARVAAIMGGGEEVSVDTAQASA